MHDFTGKVAVVTGGTGGIGGAVATAFLAQGAKVIATGWGEAELAARRADPNFACIEIHALDVSDTDTVNRFADGIDKCDILVNCAGIVIRGDAPFSESAFQRTFDINMLGTLRMSQALLPKLEASGQGAIVNIASIYSFFGTATAAGYAASKGAVMQATKSMAIAWAPKGIRVNAIAPGWINTAMSADAQSSPEFYQRIEKRTPMGRWGEPHHLSGPVLFLCSPDAAFVTGVILPVDGGYSVA